MEVISIDGTEYVKASQIAKRFRYTNDYVGQLCRGGKVDAKLVGRTWYVNPFSIEGHKTSRYLKASLNEKSLSESPAEPAHSKSVEPVLTRETSKSVAAAALNGPRFLRRVVWKPMKYEHDTSELLPPLKPTNKPFSVSVEIAESEKLPIRNLSSVTKMETEPLPEFVLQGGLKVKSIDVDFDNNEENIEISDSPDSKEADHLVVDAVGRDSYKVKIQKPNRKWKKETAVSSVKDKYSYPVEITVEPDRAAYQAVSSASFVPARVRHTEGGANLDIMAKTNDRKVVWALVFLGLLSISAAFCLTTLETVIRVDRTGYVTALEFDFSPLALPE